jgi:prolyl oligopeptidase
MEEGYKIYMYMPINLMENILTDYVSECSGNGNYIFENKKQYEDFLKRLESLDGITDTIIEKMTNGIKAKVTLHKRNVSEMINNIQEVLKEKSYTHTKKIKIRKDIWDKKVLKHLVNNLMRFLDFLINEYYSNAQDNFGLQSYQSGKQAYEKILQNETFKECNAEMIHKLGLRELKDLNEEKKRLEKVLKVDNINEYVKTTKSFYYDNKKEIIDDLKKIRKRLQKEIFPKYFHGEITNNELYDIKSAPLEMSQNTAYYMPGDLKMKVKGTFYINTFKPETVNKHELLTLSLHEGIPGHHYEINYHSQGDFPDYFKLSGYNSYSEGWGLYSETLFNYKDDIEYYFKIEYDIHRTLRLIIDTGIHHYGWDYSKCFSLMRKNLSYSDDNINRELLRYIDLPGQALTYKVGEKTLMYLRYKFLQKGYSVKDFHKLILDVGPCPLDILVEYFLENGLI